MNTATKLNNIQVLRAFAALAVVVFHSGYTFPYMRPFGSFGVDVFFVISGYIMARILDPKSPASSDFFFRRRLLRIVPPYWFFTLVLFCAALRLPQLMGATRASGVELFKSLFFIPFAKINGLIQPLLFVGWSLNYEMFFYLALAVGILLHSRLKLRLNLGLNFKFDPVWLGAALVLLVMLACTPFAGRSVLAEFYSRDVSLEFLLGILSYYLCRAIPNATARKFRLPALFACFLSAALLIASQALAPQNVFPFNSSRVLTLGLLSFLLIASASLLSQGGWDTNFSSLVLVGDASYILYLIHPYCELSLYRVFGTHHPSLRTGAAAGALLGITLSVAFAMLLHLYVERPSVRFLNRNFGGKRKALEFAPNP